MRTVASLVNEAADLMTWTGTSAADIDTAMRLGTAYPQGPLAWADAIGADARRDRAGAPADALRRAALPPLAAAGTRSFRRGEFSWLMRRPRSRRPMPSVSICSPTIARRRRWACASSRSPDGAAFLEMTVRDDMLNGFDICHGGFITTLADSAFAFACNSTGELRSRRA